MGPQLYRLTLYAFCAAPEMDRTPPEDDVRPLVHQVMGRLLVPPEPRAAYLRQAPENELAGAPETETDLPIWVR